MAPRLGHGLSACARAATLAAAFALLTAAPFLGKAWHIDEALFLPVARQILADPLHPYGFSFNWYGDLVPYSRLNNTPPVLCYLLALAYKATGGVEWAMRLSFWPFDAAAAVALYLIAARFLQRPLLPVLIVLACPAYLINMGHLMAEKPMFCFVLWSLYGLLRAGDGARRWFWASAGFLAAALLCKYSAVFAVLPVLVLGRFHGLSWRRLAAYFAVAFSGLAVYLLWDLSRDGAFLGAFWRTTAEAARWPWAPRKLRAALTFVGGCGAAALFWPYAAFREKKPLLIVAAAAAFLFLPLFDDGPVRLVDRLLGAALAAGGAWSLAGTALHWRRLSGGRFWLSWMSGVLFLLLVVYWSVMARLVLLLAAPVAFACAQSLEQRWPQAGLRKFYAAALAFSLSLSFALEAVDMRYADAQRRLAGSVSARFSGRRIWFSGHWGLQHYLEQRGGRALERSGGWDQVRGGDVVVLPRVNTNVLWPDRQVLALRSDVLVGHWLPLRLISAGEGQGGFYSDVSGFLPFSLSRAPVAEFALLEIQ